jgi:eukaryotic-like serine/threonine-protein kinase
MGGAKPGEKTLFNAARRIGSPEARRLYLAGACGEDPELCARVEALLRVHDEDAAFLQTPAARPCAAQDDLATEAPGTAIGPYALLGQIGQGGMGVVFLAEQALPVRR